MKNTTKTFKVSVMIVRFDLYFNVISINPTSSTFTSPFAIKISPRVPGYYESLRRQKNLRFPLMNNTVCNKSSQRPQ